MAKSRWWKWKPRRGTVDEGVYEVDYLGYGFELEVTDPPEEVFQAYKPRRDITLITSREVFDSWTADEDELDDDLLDEASSVYGRSLEWADNQWAWDKYMKAMTIRLEER